MFFEQRSAEPAGHKKIVAPFPTAARDPAIFFNEPRNARRNSSGTARRAGLAADNGDAKARGRAFQTAIKLFHPGGRSCRRNDQRDERELWKSRDRGEIAQRSHHCFPTDALRIRRSLKMNPLSHAIGFEDEQIFRTCKSYYRAIIAD